MIGIEKKRISRSGIYDLSNRDYHGQCCDAPSISASGLKTIVEESPAIFYRNSTLNPDYVEAPDKNAFRIGEAAHMLLLEPDLVKQKIDVIPLGMLASNGSTNTAAAKEYIADSIRHGRTPIKPSEWLNIQHMRDVIAAHPHARRALTKGQPEVSLILNDANLNIYLKSRPDFLPAQSGHYIVDYKTTADLVRWEKSACIDLRYDIQGALMLWLAAEVAGIEAKGILYLVQENIPPFQVAMLAFSIDNLSTRALLNVARLDISRAVEVFHTCLQTKVWPTGWEQPREIEAPDWHQRSAEYRLEQTTHEFPDAYRI